MPAKTVVFTSAKKLDGASHRYIGSDEYIQMSGRAGRRGKDERGSCIIMFDEKVSGFSYQSLPDIGLKVSKLEEEVATLDASGEADVAEYHKLKLEISELEKKMMPEITKPERILFYLCTGRLIQYECKMDINVEECVESTVRPFLMDVIYCWSKGASFVEVIQMTDIFECSIIRSAR